MTYKIGDIAYGKELGIVTKNNRNYPYILTKCEDCSETRWVRKEHNNQSSSKLCRKCSLIKQKETFMYSINGIPIRGYKKNVESTLL